MLLGRLGSAFDIVAKIYKLSGDPVIALIAQINRFVGVTVKGPGCPQRIQPTRGWDQGKPFPLQPTLSQFAAEAATEIAIARFQCADQLLAATTESGMVSQFSQQAKWIAEGRAKYGASMFVLNNLQWFTETIARFADFHGRPVAEVGITNVDKEIFNKGEKASPMKAVAAVALLGLLAFGAWRLTEGAR